MSSDAAVSRLNAPAPLTATPNDGRQHQQGLDPPMRIAPAALIDARAPVAAEEAHGDDPRGELEREGQYHHNLREHEQCQAVAGNLVGEAYAGASSRGCHRVPAP